MTRLTTYIGRQLLPWFALALGGAILIFLVTQLLRVAPVFAGAGAGLAETGRALLLLAVPVLGWALTPAFAVAVFAVAGRMSADGELTALDSAGVARTAALAGPALLAIPVASLSAWIWLAAAPASHTELRALIARLGGRALAGRLEPGRFYAPAPGLALFADAREGDVYRGVLIEDAREPGRVVRVAAEEARVGFDVRSESLVLAARRGTAFVSSGPGSRPSAMSFGTLEARVPVGDELAARLGFLPVEMAIPTARLLGPRSPGFTDTGWSYALWRRVAGPIGFGVLSIVSILLAFGGAWRRRGLAVAAAAALFLAYHLLGRAGESLMQAHGLLPAVAALGPAALVAGTAASLATLRAAIRYWRGARAR
ncbi:MAG: LptF/LptG family permease [Deltaproteobacteria bacterium]|nr:LptF/LptG family permease [Deltaproteobacteria bacterium]